MGLSLPPALSHGSRHVPRSGGGVKPLLPLLLAAGARLASAQEHVPPDPPRTQVHDMPYREMAQMMGMDDRRRFGKVMFDRLELQQGEESAFAWDGTAWY